MRSPRGAWSIATAGDLAPINTKTGLSAGTPLAFKGHYSPYHFSSLIGRRVRLLTDGVPDSAALGQGRHAVDKGASTRDHASEVRSPIQRNAASE